MSVEQTTDPAEVGIDAATEMVSNLPAGQKAWGTKEFRIAQTAAMSSVTAERERCAKIAETMADWSEVADSSTGYAIAKRIRSGV